MKRLARFGKGLSKARPPQLSFLSAAQSWPPGSERAGLERTPFWLFPQSAVVLKAWLPISQARREYESTFRESETPLPHGLLTPCLGYFVQVLGRLTVAGRFYC